MVDGLCQRYHQRPSEVLGIEDRFVALDFDVAVAVRASKMEEGELADPKLIQKRQDGGFKSVEMLQQQVKQSRRQNG